MSIGVGESTAPSDVDTTPLGVVIEIPSPLRERLRDWRLRYGGADASIIDPHITLVSGSTSVWDQAAAHVRRIARRSKAFTIRLQGTGTFRPVTDVVYLNVTTGADACTELHDALLTGPLGHDLSFGYHPHLTIAHDVADSLLDAAQKDLSHESMDFDVTSIGLFGIDEAGRWSLREELDLGPEQT
ncbi:2'-5' RNA ligase [Arthrobacter sp. MYb227]|uniref:2'-5' RNA ligase family protein n=1 Tax=Arthrobacter sp. MYb227 TaxID=1848601 RepID=UPI000CFDAA53|nr:2'-5' RNA ligase family protein [Arthrobacter sp. MYb227]PQZ91656.1 2'-5' RNA ligase [Arthrobacter sp. MYb227]